MREFILDIVRQLFGWSKPRTGKLILTHFAFKRMEEYRLDTDTLWDVYRYGDEVRKDMLVRRYRDYTAGMIVASDGGRDDQFMIVTCWKRNNWGKGGERYVRF